jgi:DNA modification methylase
MNRAWPADRVERRSLQSLAASESNARTHSAEQIGQIVASMQRWGWTVPILVDEGGEIIAGHGRLEAARQLGLAEAPVMVAAGWSEAEKRAYRLADNQLGLNAGWDLGTLSKELQQLKEWDFDLTLLGFTDLDALMRGPQKFLTDPDAAPPCPREPRSHPGDVWTMGRHRLMCGDSTARDVVDCLLANAKPHLMVTDPPYGVDYDPKWRRGFAPGAEVATGIIRNDDRCDWYAAWQHFPGSVAYVWHSGLHCSEVQRSLERAGFGLRAQIVWVKTRPVISRGHYHWQHEPLAYLTKDAELEDHWRFVPEHEIVSYAVEGGHSAAWNGGRKQSTIWQIEHLKNDTGHAAQKPIECMRRPLDNNSKSGDGVYDPFVGSGTSIIAAEMTGRTCYACEIDPAYVDVSVLRWQAFTGQSAIRERDGAAFGVVEEVAA